MENSRDRKTILIVDDVPANIGVINAVLKSEYNVKVATSGAKALDLLLSGPHPDLILLDVLMPEVDGYQVCAALKSDRTTRDIPILFLTAKTELEDEVKGFELGAVDYITKPINPPVLLARVKTHLSLTEAQSFLRQQNELLERRVFERTREVVERTQQLEEFQEATMIALCSLAEAKDTETSNHLRRTQHYVKALARKLQELCLHRNTLTESYIACVFKTAPLHDIGKVGVPDSILVRQGKLTPFEFEIMKSHTKLGRDALEAAQKHLNVSSPFFAQAQEIAYSHHEKWDGSGYPLGLRGQDIPLSGRMMALADAYDDLLSKKAASHEEALEIIQAGKGSHFDPALSDAFVAIGDQIREISLQFSDQN